MLKLHDIVASTLGAELAATLRVTLDNHLAESSPQFFDLRTISALRGKVAGWRPRSARAVPSGMRKAGYRVDVRQQV